MSFVARILGDRIVPARARRPERSADAVSRLDVAPHRGEDRHLGAALRRRRRVHVRSRREGRSPVPAARGGVARRARRHRARHLVSRSDSAGNSHARAAADRRAPGVRVRRGLGVLGCGVCAARRGFAGPFACGHARARRRERALLAKPPQSARLLDVRVPRRRRGGDARRRGRARGTTLSAPGFTRMAPAPT